MVTLSDIAYDPAGFPLKAGFKVTAHTVSEATGNVVETPAGTTTTDARGRWSLTLPDNYYEVRVHTEGTQRASGLRDVQVRSLEVRGALTVKSGLRVNASAPLYDEVLTVGGNLAATGDVIVGNSSGDARNAFRLDGYNNTLYVCARSDSGAASGAGIALRTGDAGAGEQDRLAIAPSGLVSVYQALALGSNPASAGLLRLPNNQWIAARNAANNGDVNLAKLNASDRIELGTSLEALNVGTATGAPTGRIYVKGSAADWTTSSWRKGIALDTTSALELGWNAVTRWGIGASSNLYVFTATGEDSSANLVYRLIVTNGGNVLVGTTTDAGYKLDVNGSARIVGGLNVGTLTGALTGDGLFSGKVGVGKFVDADTPGMQIEYTDGSAGTVVFRQNRWGATWIFKHNVSGGDVTDLLIDSAGNVHVGQTLGLGQRLEVGGAALLRGACYFAQAPGVGTAVYGYLYSDSSGNLYWHDSINNHDHQLTT